MDWTLFTSLDVHIGGMVVLTWSDDRWWGEVAYRILTNRGLASYQMGDLAGAFADYKQALQLKPDFPNLIYNIAGIYTLRGYPDAALELLAQAVHLDEYYGEIARTDPDFDSIRTDPRFIALMSDNEPEPLNS